MTKLEECETALRKVLLEVYGIGLTGDDIFASRVVLRVLREPDEAMVQAGMKCADVSLVAEFTAMIDAVLDNKA